MSLPFLLAVGSLIVPFRSSLVPVYARGFWNGNAAAEQWLLGAPRTAEVALTTSF